MMKAEWDRYKFFKPDEFLCHCGCGRGPQDMNHTFMLRLDLLRRWVGKPFRVTSGFRCPDHNAKVSKTGRAGPHTTGRAVDIAVARGTAYDVIVLVKQASMTGLGVAQKGKGRFLHLDDLPDAPGQPRPTVWSY